MSAPPQYVPLTAMSTRPRNLAGISSSMAELIAAYSPPIPIPAMKRDPQSQYTQPWDDRGQGTEEATEEIDPQGDHEEISTSPLV